MKKINYKKIITVFISMAMITFGYGYKNYNQTEQSTITEHKTKTINIKKSDKNKNLKSGKVIKVYDADTITVLDSNNEKIKIRLYGIDAPELKQTYGKTAQMYAEKILKNQNIKYLEMNKDRYGRVVALVYLTDDIVINEVLVKSGNAFVYEEYNEFLELYTSLENEAKSRKLGVWGIKNMQKPSEWRKEYKK